MAGDNIQEVMDKLKSRYEAAVRSMAPVMANEAVNFTKERFDKSIDVNDRPFAPRKVNNRRNQGKKILIDTNRLQRSVRVLELGDKRFSYGTTGVPYAGIHNNGGTIVQAARSETFTRLRKTRGVNKGQFKKGKGSGKGFTFGQRTIRMPQRQYLGKSPLLVKRITDAGKKQFFKAFKASS